RMRVCSNVFTSLVITPVIVLWGTSRFAHLRNISRRRIVEAIVFSTGLLLVNFTVFCWVKTGPATIPWLLYAPLPFLLWAAVRFGAPGPAPAILVAALLAITGAVNSRGPFASNSPEENALSIQVFFVVVSITLMFLAASIAERGKAEERFTKAFRSS